ncbi:DUF3040 domain-containing protein [Corynebacterium sp. MC-17D]|uniref:DUF3040 domain-containing protein n=1 Tax=Corynebacterium lipophilum TaxID=2804918 RepID=A0AAW5HQ64_9CORY|nr:DUF3040 domain-containing protein [Corynebacterium lipophilum]MCO6393399.1 DUF3040 domain-containing protein [Corynebacterium lipophilum]MCZ2116653.1 DUF3040 domain-containing protein [Corynebacterium lipophilum]
MSLSEQEQQALRAIEQSLMADDPSFVQSVGRNADYAAPSSTGRITVRSVALMVLGVVLLLGGVALASLSIWTVIISVIGFGVMMAGGIMALRTPAHGPSVSQLRNVSRNQPKSPRVSSMEQNFKRRFEDRP